MKNKLFNKHFGVFIILFVIILGVLVTGYLSLTNSKEPVKTVRVSSSTLDTQLLAKGSVRSMNEATLHFQTGGKLTYLPFKEGDKVTTGQTIASLDTYTIQKQLEAALNSYRVTRNSFDQTQENAQYNIAQGQDKLSVDAAKAGVGGNDESTVVNDMVKRLVDQNQANLDNSVIQVQLANYAFSLAALTSPIDGILIHEDVKNTNTNVTPATAFTVIDPSALVFRANIPEDEISYISEGAQATIQLTGQNNKQIIGTITKIYPEKVTLPTGENIYQVDISAPDLAGNSQYNQDGVVLINNKYNQSLVLVPSWLILNNQYIWVEENGKAVLKKVTIGDTVGQKTTVLSGLKNSDTIIENPKSIAQNHYLSL